MKETAAWQFLADLMQNPWWRMVMIVILSVLAATVLRLAVMPVLKMLTRKTESDLDDRIFDRTKPAMFQTVILLGFYWALVDRFVTDRAHFWIAGSLVTILVLIWGRVLLDLGQLVFKRLALQADRFDWIQPKTLPLIQFGYKVVVIAIQAYFVLSAWQVSLTSWLASAGVIGIAVGFAAKDTLANFISGVFILADAPYKVGDYINIDDQTRGIVTDIGMRSTRLLTRDNIEVTLPNAVIGNAKVVNESSGPSTTMRVRVDVGVAYGSDVDQVKAVLLECIKDVPYTTDPHRSSVRFRAMGDSSLQFQMRVWVAEPENRGKVVDILNTRAYNALAEADIKIPFPQRDLHIKSWEQPSGAAVADPSDQT